MSIGEVAGNIVGFVCLVVWLFCLVGWIRRGVTIPTYLHVIALATTCLGLGCAVGMVVSGTATLALSLLLLLLPSTLTYSGWFWLFGPEANRSSRSPE